MKVHNPFRVALVATLGVGVGLLLISSVQTLSTILLYVGTALFLSLGLEPAISFLERRKLPRWAAVLITILGVLAAFAGIVLMLVPIIAGQISQLVEAITKLELTARPPCTAARPRPGSACAGCRAADGPAAPARSGCARAGTPAGPPPPAAAARCACAPRE